VESLRRQGRRTGLKVVDRVPRGTFYSLVHTLLPSQTDRRTDR